jgi:hypothetical protein
LSSLNLQKPKKFLAKITQIRKILIGQFWRKSKEFKIYNFHEISNVSYRIFAGSLNYNISPNFRCSKNAQEYNNFSKSKNRKKNKFQQSNKKIIRLTILKVILEVGILKSKHIILRDITIWSADIYGSLSKQEIKFFKMIHKNKIIKRNLSEIYWFLYFIAEIYF